MRDIAQASAGCYRGLDRGRIFGKRLPAYCFNIRHRRASRTVRLSAPEHHRYVRFLDWKVTRGHGKALRGDGRNARKSLRAKK